MESKLNGQIRSGYRSLAYIEYQWQFEKTVAEISNTFISANDTRMDQAILKALRLCGEFFEVERSYIFQLSEDGKSKSNTHEWCGDGVKSQKERMQNLPVGDFQWLMKRVRQDEYLYIPDVTEMPSSAAQEKKFFLDNDISSIILIALTIEGEMKGFFGFDLPAGKRVWKYEQLAFLKEVTGIISGVIARLDAGKEIYKKEEIFRSISENAFDLIALLDLEGYYLYCNHPYLDSLGYEPQELIGESAFDIIHPAEKNKMARLFLESVESRTAGATLLMRLICKDGSFKWIEHNIKQMLLEDYEPDKVLINARDISEQKQAEDQLVIQRNLGVRLAGASNLRQALNYCLAAAIDSSIMDSGGVYLVDPDTGTLELSCHQGLPAYYYHNCNYYTPDSPIAKLVKDGESSYGNIEEDLNCDDVIAREGLKAFAVLPIRVEEKTIAALNVASHTFSKIPKSSLVALETIVSQVYSAGTRIQAEQNFQKSVEKYKTLVSNIPGIIFSCELDTEKTMKHISGEVEELTGYKASDFINNQVRSYSSIMHPDDREHVYNTIIGHQLKEHPYHVRYRIITADGSIRWFRESGRAIHNKDSPAGPVSHIDGVIIDMTDLKRYEEQLHYLSRHDQLTGLPNRAFFESELSRLEKDGKHPISIISMDLDGLKLINDSMDHDTGDQVLKACAGILEKSFRSSDILARVGGDEFAVILPDTDSKTSENVTRRIREKIASYNNDNPDLPVSLSMGVATAEKSDTSVKSLFKQADDLMYRDKLYSSFSGRNKIVKSLMTALSERDFITEGHAMRLEKLCLKLGEMNDLSSKQLADLALLSQAHDLGKAGIPDKILFKTESLDEAEWEIMKMHPEKGYRIALSSPELAGVAEYILKHHERWDGKGYPLGLKGEDIPVLCRILAVVDAFDAMTSERPYKPAMSIDDAKKELLACAGQQFDPHLVEMLLKLPELAD